MYRIWLIYLVVLASVLVNSRAQSRSYSALCAVGNNENRFVREWADYHLCLGLGTIHVFDHNSTPGMDTELREVIAQGKVTYDRFEGNHTRFTSGFSSKLERFNRTAQGYAYRECLNKYRDQHTFVGFIDMDEFMVLNDPTAPNVDAVLKDYEPYGGVSFHWRAMGSSGHDRRPAGSVVSAYTSCMSERHEVNRQIKTFLNTKFGPIMTSPHRAYFPDFEKDAQSRGEEGDGKPALAGGPFLVDEQFKPLLKGLKNRAIWDRVAVYHYVTKSKEDFEAKVLRGGGAGVTRGMSQFEKINNQAYDTCLGAIKTRERFCPQAAL